MTLPFMAQPDALPAKPMVQANAKVKPLPFEPDVIRDQVVEEAAQRYKVPVVLALAVSHVENWRGLPEARSSRGAVGIMQVMPVMHGSTAEQLKDPGHNADVGVRVLRHYFERYGNWDKALRAYNGALHKPNAGDKYVALVRTKMRQLGGTDAERSTQQK